MMHSNLFPFLAWVAAGLCGQVVTSFVVIPSPPARAKRYTTSTSRHMSSAPEIPTVDELSKDPFMKQLGHAQTVFELLSQEETEEKNNYLESLLTAQLSHGDGIRGFFATYLTQGDDANPSPADNKSVPEALQKAMSKVLIEDADELIPLACMNVVMPTGMITMHEDPNLSEASRKTSERGSRILASLMDHPVATENCKAILSVATDGVDPKCFGAKSDMVEYWTDFFGKWGYKEEQKKDIAKTIANIIS